MKLFRSVHPNSGDCEARSEYPETVARRVLEELNVDLMKEREKVGRMKSLLYHAMTRHSACHCKTCDAIDSIVRKGVELDDKG